MKLWILRRLDVPEWRTAYETCEYDSAYGFVVRAYSEREARIIARLSSGLTDYSGGEEEKWLDAALTSCDELTVDGTQGLILRDYLCG